MKKKVTLLFFLVSFFCTNKSFAQKNLDSIKSYVTFLKQSHLSAKNYILSLFDRYDIVIFFERTHDEFTQYELISELIKSKKFSDKVGNIFMEIGGSNFDTEINQYLHNPNLTDEQIRNTALSIQRNMMWYPIWERYNYYYLLTELYKVNKGLADNKKISLHPSDLAIEWPVIHTSEDVKNHIICDSVQDSRDSIMAHNIVAKIDQINARKNTRKKYFIILNSAHAVNGNYHLIANNYKSAASFLFEKYGNKVANVLINMESLPRNITPQTSGAKPILNGKWDAAFEYLGTDDKGFDIKNSPLEHQTFENFPMVDSLKTNEEVCTGYVFYRSFPKQENINGVPGIVTPEFQKELIRRWKIFYKDLKATKTEMEEWALDRNKIKRKNVDGLSDIWEEVSKWLND
jgi:LAS superfamily LD-carboxypeptidase LdcB